MSLLWKTAVEQHAAGLNGDLPEGLRFVHHAPDARKDPSSDVFDGDWDSADHEQNHWITAHTPESPSPIGSLELRGRDWDDDEKMMTRPRGEILDVSVSPKYRRRGVGRAMVEHARSLGLPVHHSPTRSEDGEAWSHAVSPGHGVPRLLGED